MAIERLNSVRNRVLDISTRVLDGLTWATLRPVASMAAFGAPFIGVGKLAEALDASEPVKVAALTVSIVPGFAGAIVAIVVAGALDADKYLDWAIWGRPRKVAQRGFESKGPSPFNPEPPQNPLDPDSLVPSPLIPPPHILHEGAEVIPDFSEVDPIRIPVAV